MSTPHNEANIGDIAKTVVMPGDPLRAKYIAENFLDNYNLVNHHIKEHYLRYILLLDYHFDQLNIL